MSVRTTTRLGPLLEAIVRDLDISPTKYNEAVDHYTAVGNWLDAPDSPLAEFHPRVYPQGSFRLGTVVRPVSGGKEADYDIDLVCQLDAIKRTVSAKRLKHMIGDRLKEHGTYRKMLDPEGRRCWTLQYAESDCIGFHLDALPAISEDDVGRTALVNAGVPDQLTEHAIAVSERHGPDAYSWLEGGSNPFGYAAWFDSINRAAFLRVATLQKQLLFEANRTVYASVDGVPDALVRTPLQRVVQLLKRHRDVRFSGHEWESQKPISIIITTLCALAYDGQADVETALFGVLGKIDDFKTSGLIVKRNGDWVIPNPVNPGENFAERWNDPGSHRAEAFFEWVSWVRQDLALAEDQESEHALKQVLAESLGLSGRTPGSTSTGTPIVTGHDRVPDLASTAHRQTPPWPIQNQCRVQVMGDVRRHREATRSLWRLSRRPVPKTFGIRFRVETDAPAPYEVKWQVVNTGTEAAAAGPGQMRGGFEDGEGAFGAIKRESTAYLGTHTIEAFVIKDGVCVGRSGPVPVKVN